MGGRMQIDQWKLPFICYINILKNSLIRGIIISIYYTLILGLSISNFVILNDSCQIIAFNNNRIWKAKYIVYSFYAIDT